MQSGYGVPELQQFMVDGCSTAASLLPISYDMNAAAAPPMQLQQQQHGGHFFRSPAQSPPTHHFFLHHQFHGFPFAGGHNHQHQHQQQRRMHPELGLGDNQDDGGFESSAGGSPPPKIICGQLGVAPTRFVATNFSLAVSEAAAAGEEAGLNGDDAVTGGGSDCRDLPRWHQQQAREVDEEEEVEAAIKEPFWYTNYEIPHASDLHSKIFNKHLNLLPFPLHRHCRVFACFFSDPPPTTHFMCPKLEAKHWAGDLTDELTYVLMRQSSCTPPRDSQNIELLLHIVWSVRKKVFL